MRPLNSFLCYPIHYSWHIVSNVYFISQTALTAESTVNVVSRVFVDTSTAVVVSQGVLILFASFGAGLFIPWNATPVYWVWLQELSFFTQSSRAAIAHLNDTLSYKCFTAIQNECTSFGLVYKCDPDRSTPEYCMVAGRDVMYTLVGTDPKYSPASAFGYLVLILVVTRLGVLLLMFCPAASIASYIRRMWSRNVEDRMIEIQMKNRNLEGKTALSFIIPFNDFSLLSFPFSRPFDTLYVALHSLPHRSDCGDCIREQEAT
jgi:hypothetical protein